MPAPQPRPAATVTAGAFSVRVDPDAGDLALLHGAAILLHFPLDGLELTLVALVAFVPAVVGEIMRSVRGRVWVA